MYIVKEESFSTDTHCSHTSLINCYIHKILLLLLLDITL